MRAAAAASRTTTIQIAHQVTSAHEGSNRPARESTTHATSPNPTDWDDRHHSVAGWILTRIRLTDPVGPPWRAESEYQVEQHHDARMDRA